MNPPLDPLCAEIAPAEPLLTPYDHEHAVTYLRMLDAHSEGADWRDVSRIVLHTDPERDAHRARRAYESHLARAKWVSRHGYRQLRPRSTGIFNRRDQANAPSWCPPSYHILSCWTMACFQTGWSRGDFGGVGSAVVSRMV